MKSVSAANPISRLSYRLQMLPMATKSSGRAHGRAKGESQMRSHTTKSSGRSKGRANSESQLQRQKPFVRGWTPAVQYIAKLASFGWTEFVSGRYTRRKMTMRRVWELAYHAGKPRPAKSDMPWESVPWEPARISNTKWELYIFGLSRICAATIVLNERLVMVMIKNMQCTIPCNMFLNG